MTDRPIIFSGSMVKALLDGRKTMTRRIINPQPTPFRLPSDDRAFGLKKGDLSPVTLEYIGDDPWPRIATSRVITRQEVRFKPGMRLWVRERIDRSGGLIQYHADHCTSRHLWPAPKTVERDSYPSIHMPRRASRLTLNITEVKIERLQAITPEDAEAEGVFRHIAEWSIDKVYRSDRAATARLYFLDIWENLHGLGSWDENPWIVALRFSVEHRNIDAPTP